MAEVKRVFTVHQKENGFGHRFSGSTSTSVMCVKAGELLDSQYKDSTTQILLMWYMNYFLNTNRVHKQNKLKLLTYNLKNLVLLTIDHIIIYNVLKIIKLKSY